MPQELKDRLLQELREQGKLPPGLDDEQVDRLMEICWVVTQTFTIAFREIVERMLAILNPAMEVLCDNLRRLMNVVNEELPRLLPQLLVKLRPRLPRPPKRISAPRARMIFDRRPRYIRARTTI